MALKAAARHFDLVVLDTWNMRRFRHRGVGDALREALRCLASQLSATIVSRFYIA